MSKEYKYETPEEQFNRQMNEIAFHRAQIDNSEQAIQETDTPLGVQLYEEDLFKDHTFLVSIPKEEYVESVGDLTDKSFSAFFEQLRAEADYKELQVLADFKKRKAWEKIGELIGVSEEDMKNPNNPNYAMAWDEENGKVMFFYKDPSTFQDEENILRALLGE